MDKFQKRRMRHVQYQQRRKQIKKKQKKLLTRSVLFGLLGILFLIAIIGFIIVYILYLRGVPSIDDIETSFKQSSIIYDRDGNRLYTISDGGENRLYASYEQISPKIIDAVIAMEDKTFFDNAGFDAIGIFRSALDCATKRTSTCGGGSTLSQQLIKNTLLTNERSIQRKVRELYLSWRLNQKFSKERIIELYLNKISFGSNSDGVQQASKRFFDKKAKDVTTLEASILASLPKGPTAYNPYSKRNRLMGYVYIYDIDSPDDHYILPTDSDAIETDLSTESFIKLFSDLQISTDGNNTTTRICGIPEGTIKSGFSLRDDCTTLKTEDLLEFLNAIQISSDSINLEYQAGRKDRVLMRMLEDGHITTEEFQEALIEGLSYEFADPRDSIKYPHFVFYVREYLEQTYGETFFESGGWKIYTTIDPKLQDKAEELIASQSESNSAKFDIKNQALIGIDNNNGEILSMVGSADYYNKDIDGEVNVITSSRQPGSSFKPLIFARAFEKGSWSPDTPIYDVPTRFGNWQPSNYDGKYLGTMTLKTALAYSRNTTAAKMYYMATKHESESSNKESDLVSWLQSIGLDSFQKREPGNLYGAPISLGTGEIKPLEFANVYATFARNGEKIATTPILRLIDSQGNEIELESEKTESMKPGAAYMITSILSDTTARPAFWNTYLDFPGHDSAAKTGTSNVIVRGGANKKILPRDLWVAGYTPDITTIVWSGNTDGSPANSRGNGLEASGPTWKAYMQFAMEDRKYRKFEQPKEIKGQGGFIYIQGQEPDVLEAIEPEIVQVDGFCAGKVTDTTPADAVKDGLLIPLAFPVEQYDDLWKQAAIDWLATVEGKTHLSEIFSLTEDQVLVLESPENACERPNPIKPVIVTNLTNGSNYASGEHDARFEFLSSHPLTTLEVIIRDTVYKTHDLGEQKQAVIDSKFVVVPNQASQSVKVVVTDIYGFTYEFTYPINLLKSDKNGPLFNISHDKEVTLTSGQSYRFSGVLTDDSNISDLSIYVDGQLYGSPSTKTEYDFSIKHSDLDPGEHQVRIDATDELGNTSSLSISVNVI